MDNEIQLISDGDGLAVLGEEKAVERFLRDEGLWAASKALDLRGLKPLLTHGSNVTQAAAEVTANAGRWMKLTGDSAKVAKRFPLLKDPKTGNSYATAKAKDGHKFVKNLQFEGGPGSLLTNPAALSGAAGLMTQTAIQQTMAEITDYLVRIDAKVDDVLRKVDDTVVAQMVGAGHTIERALTIREETGSVNETLWSTVDQTHQTIGATQTYALDQLDAVAKKLEETKVGGLAAAAALAEHEVPKWLAVLARCFQLQDAIDVIELDRVLAESPHELDAYRRGLKKAQAGRRELVSEHTAHLLARMDKAVETANAKIVWNRTKSLDVVASANDLAAGLDDFHGLLTIEADLRSWEPRELGRAAEVASQAIQQSKDKGPGVVGTAALAATAVGLGKKYGGGDQA
ncbi:hypothetical protein ASD11_04895 [Aeromicrobium sp. Root495]|uniref:hypothetical protein n=1 Tax=Aeromicrobium sp. Root495 TaxID=1736550 RepID=UPI0006F3E5B4|nr:hypothetical protein [Aeromicrobium sp. Root495]KQY58959.1 hypothetical protein ASD11_04895 [Aeromicrobium sp. Root495]